MAAYKHGSQSAGRGVCTHQSQAAKEKPHTAWQSTELPAGAAGRRQAGSRPGSWHRHSKCHNRQICKVHTGHGLHAAQHAVSGHAAVKRDDSNDRIPQGLTK